MDPAVLFMCVYLFLVAAINLTGPSIGPLVLYGQLDVFAHTLALFLVVVDVMVVPISIAIQLCTLLFLLRNISRMASGGSGKERRVSS